MSEAQQGDTVRVHYTGTLADGTVFDTSRDTDPLEFTIGAGQVIPGFDTAVSGMAPGQEKRVVIAPDDAYGERRDDLLVAVERERFPADIEPQVGQQFQMTQEGNTYLVTVRDVSDDAVTLDLNHPLAGEDLTFELELVEIR
jgi:peptidylprolyl isomerase